MSAVARTPPTAAALHVSAPQVRVRLARREDLSRTARIHRRCLPEGFFARLGTEFLVRYHATFAASPHATLLVVEEGDEIVGFLAGTVDNPAHYRSLVRRRPVGLALSGIGAVLRDRRLAAEFVRTRTGRYSRAIGRQLRRRSGPGEAAVADAPTVAVLTHVAVTEAARGSGAGRALVDAFTERARDGGADEVRLVAAVEGAAPRFYRHLGWTSRGTRPAADGSVVEEFVLPL